MWWQGQLASPSHGHTSSAGGRGLLWWQGLHAASENSEIRFSNGPASGQPGSASTAPTAKAPRGVACAGRPPAHQFSPIMQWQGMSCGMPSPSIMRFQPLPVLWPARPPIISPAPGRPCCGWAPPIMRSIHARARPLMPGQGLQGPQSFSGVPTGGHASANAADSARHGAPRRLGATVHAHQRSASSVSGAPSQRTAGRERTSSRSPAAQSQRAMASLVQAECGTRRRSARSTSYLGSLWTICQGVRAAERADERRLLTRGVHAAAEWCRHAHCACAMPARRRHVLKQSRSIAGGCEFQ